MQGSIKRLGVVALLLVAPFAYSPSTAGLASAQNTRDAVAAPGKSQAGKTPQDKIEPQGGKSGVAIEKDLLGGIIVNRTVTVLGWDFYKDFTAIWQALHDKDQFTLSIHERPTARWGSEIWIQYGQQRVFHTFLAPARSASKTVAQEAVQMVYENVVNINVQRALYSDIDLAPPEL